jgi:hypothetical protein
VSDLLEIIDASYLHDKTIHLKFNNDEEFDVDLTPMVENDKIGVFKPLQDNNVFKRFRIDYTLCWNEEIDVAPEYLYFLANIDNPNKQNLFKEWGYLN